MNEIQRFVKKNAPTILTLLSCAGVVGTAVLVAKSAPETSKKLEESRDENGKITKDTAIIFAKGYGPAMAIGAGTMACMIGANILNTKKQGQITAAYGVCNEMFKQYRKEVVNRYGEEVDEDICNAIMLRSTEDYMCNYLPNVDYPDKKVWFHEPITDQWLLCYERFVMDAEFHTNHNFTMGGSLCFNDWLTMLGLETRSRYYVDNFFHNEEVDGDLFGWSMHNGDYYWISFSHIWTKKYRDGIPVFELDYGGYSWPDLQPEEEMPI